MSDDRDLNEDNVTSIYDKWTRTHFENLLARYLAELPPPSARFDNLIFVYDEQLATENREFLFEQLNALARKAGQRLVIQDVGYKRSRFYVTYEEIGEIKRGEEIDYDAVVDHWSGD